MTNERQMRRFLITFSADERLALGDDLDLEADLYALYGFRQSDLSIHVRPFPPPLKGESANG